MGPKGQYQNNESRNMGCMGLHKENREIRMETEGLTFIRIYEVSC